MSSALHTAGMALLRRLDPERAHDLALRALTLGWGRSEGVADDPRLAVSALGLRFTNPIGLAAGFDKNGAALAGSARLGFGFVEVGTVTPRAQPGNAKPRLFRLGDDHAIVNRLGFNNAGIAVLAARLSARNLGRCIVGANIGLNKVGSDPERDYPAMVSALAGQTDYVTINVSSPNTPGLRDLQAADRLQSILTAIVRAAPLHPPLLVKIAPDLADDALGPLVEVCVEGGVAGLIVSNTTLARPAGLTSARAAEAGGLSGRPLWARSTRMLARAARASRGRLVLVGVGGIFTAADIVEKLRAGASLVQIYTAFAYEGPGLIPRLRRELPGALEAAGHADVASAIGADIDALADPPLHESV